jgi:hypothetical protein
MSISQRETADKYTLGRATHSPSKYRNFSTTIIELLADIIGVDPTETRLHLEDHVSIDDLDRGLRADHEAGRKTSAAFQYGGYTVECYSNGDIYVLACKDDYENGTVELPASMHDSL